MHRRVAVIIVAILMVGFGIYAWETLSVEAYPELGDTAAQVTNAVDATGSYANPAWITSLAWSKLTASRSKYVMPRGTLVRMNQAVAELK